MKICPNCYYHGKPKLIAKGSLTITILLLLVFFPLGILYALLNSTGSSNVCPKCENAMIPDDSVRAKEILKK